MPTLGEFMNLTQQFDSDLDQNPTTEKTSEKTIAEVLNDNKKDSDSYWSDTYRTGLYRRLSQPYHPPCFKLHDPNQISSKNDVQALFKQEEDLKIEFNTLLDHPCKSKCDMLNNWID